MRAIPLDWRPVRQRLSFGRRLNVPWTDLVAVWSGLAAPRCWAVFGHQHTLRLASSLRPTATAKSGHALIDSRDAELTGEFDFRQSGRHLEAMAVRGKANHPLAPGNRAASSRIFFWYSIDSRCRRPSNRSFRRC